MEVRIALVALFLSGSLAACNRPERNRDVDASWDVDADVGDSGPEPPKPQDYDAGPNPPKPDSDAGPNPPKPDPDAGPNPAKPNPPKPDPNQPNPSKPNPPKPKPDPNPPGPKPDPNPPEPESKPLAKPNGLGTTPPSGGNANDFDLHFRTPDDFERVRVYINAGGACSGEPARVVERADLETTADGYSIRLHVEDDTTSVLAVITERGGLRSACSERIQYDELTTPYLRAANITTAVHEPGSLYGFLIAADVERGSRVRFFEGDNCSGTDLTRTVTYFDTGAITANVGLPRNTHVTRLWVETSRDFETNRLDEATCDWWNVDLDTNESVILTVDAIERERQYDTTLDVKLSGRAFARTLTAYRGPGCPADEIGTVEPAGDGTWSIQFNHDAWQQDSISFLLTGTQTAEGEEQACLDRLDLLRFVEANGQLSSIAATVIEDGPAFTTFAIDLSGPADDVRYRVNFSRAPNCEPEIFRGAETTPFSFRVDKPITELYGFMISDDFVRSPCTLVWSAACDPGPDADGDGFRTGACAAVRDCDDSDATRYPGHEELCDGKDNDCDGVIDGAGAAQSCEVPVGGSAGCTAGACSQICNDPSHRVEGDRCVAPPPRPAPNRLSVAVYRPRHLKTCVVGNACDPNGRCTGLFGDDDQLVEAFADDGAFRSVSSTSPEIGQAEKVVCMDLLQTDAALQQLDADLELFRSNVWTWSYGDIELTIHYVDIDTMDVAMDQYQYNPDFRTGLWLDAAHAEPSIVASLDFIPDFNFVVPPQRDPNTGLHHGNGGACGLTGGRIAGAGWSWFSCGGYLHEWLHQVDDDYQTLSNFDDVYDGAFPACGTAEYDPKAWFPDTHSWPRDPDYHGCGDEYPGDIDEHILRVHWDPEVDFVANHCKDGIQNKGESGVDVGAGCITLPR